MYAVDDTVAFRKILIVSAEKTDKAFAEKDHARFARFAAVLRAGGFDAMHASVTDMEGLSALIDDFDPDIVFSSADHLALDGARVSVHAWLENIGMPYVGSSPEVIDLALSKPRLKRRWQARGLRTPEYRALDLRSRGSRQTAHPPFPCIVKPADAGNSEGIDGDSVVADEGQLAHALERLEGEYRFALVERYLGRFPDFEEVTCACVGNGRERLVMPARLSLVKPRGSTVISSRDKEDQNAVALAIDDAVFLRKAREFAAQALKASGIRDYARCDLIWADGVFWALEVNGQPMVPDAWFEACCRRQGLGDDRYLIAIAEAAIRRVAASTAVRPKT